MCSHGCYVCFIDLFISFIGSLKFLVFQFEIISNCVWVLVSYTQCLLIAAYFVHLYIFNCIFVCEKVFICLMFFNYFMHQCNLLHIMFKK